MEKQIFSVNYTNVLIKCCLVDPSKKFRNFTQIYAGVLLVLFCISFMHCSDIIVHCHLGRVRGGVVFDHVTILVLI